MNAWRSVWVRFDLLSLAVVLFFIALLELIVAVFGANPDGGANIGLGIAVMSMLGSIAAASLGAWIRRQPPSSIERGVAVGLGGMILFFVVSMIVMLLFGILEEFA